MLRRVGLLGVALSALVAAALAVPARVPQLLLLAWSHRASADASPVALVIELGLKDREPTSWAGRATVQGARVVHREGYRFRENDRLLEPDAWEVSSHEVLHPRHRRPPPRPTDDRRPRLPWELNRIAPAGVLLQLRDVKPDATLTIRAGDGHPPAVISLHAILDGHVRPLWQGRATVRRVSAPWPGQLGATGSEPDEDDFPAAAYAPDGTLWVAFIRYTLNDPQRRSEWTQMPREPATFQAFYHPEFGDQLWVQSFHGGRWTPPQAITGSREDLARCALAVAGDGTVWVVYSAHRGDRFDLFARSLRPGSAAPPGPEQRLTSGPGSVLGPVACTNQAGDVLAAAQVWDRDGGHIALFQCRAGHWTSGPELPSVGTAGNRWYPALAAGPTGQVAVGYDVYNAGDYDVRIAVLDGNRVTDRAIAASARFEARPSLAYDVHGRLWIAYEEGPEGWGKNFGALETDRGHPLYDVRAVRVVCLDNARLLQPLAPLPVSTADPGAPVSFQTRRCAYPRLSLDGRGRLWLAYRANRPVPFGPNPGTTWLTLARRLDGDHWSEALEVSHSDGLLDSRPVLLPDAGGGLLVLSNTDGRHRTPEKIGNQVFASVLDLPGRPAEPVLEDRDPGSAAGKGDAAERAAVDRIRAYRVASGGKTYRFLRGDFHRHTEISFDGGGEGSLEDCFRYALDAAALDWIAVTDHDSGLGREYPWWLIQKASDAYHRPGAFVPLFAYERSVDRPMGHRNVLFARRGVTTLPRLAEPDEARQVGGVSANDTRMLYRYLHELHGLCASHTSATKMGTDWRDHDPDAEPIVEIYQGERMSYEKEGAPRTGHDPRSGEVPVNLDGWYPEGYIDHALGRGYQLGFQASSDHISTHIAYAVVLAENATREGILAALRQRHVYAATDNIVLDLRSGEHLMGDAFSTSSAPTLHLRAIGATQLLRVDILRDSDVVATLNVGRPEFETTWTDSASVKGRHYYYVRVRQADGELAWSSPMWIDYAP